MGSRASVEALYAAHPDKAKEIIIRNLENILNTPSNNQNIEEKIVDLISGLPQEEVDIITTLILDIVQDKSTGYEILSPNGGEIFEYGQSLNITFTTPLSLENVRIDLYSVDKGNSENWDRQIIVESVANTGSYTWVVGDRVSMPEYPANFYIIVCDPSSPLTMNDMSDSSFDITYELEYEIVRTNAGLNRWAQGSNSAQVLPFSPPTINPNDGEHNPAQGVIVGVIKRDNGNFLVSVNYRFYSNISNTFHCDLYFYEINKEGLVIASKGFGKVSNNESLVGGIFNGIYSNGGLVEKDGFIYFGCENVAVKIISDFVNETNALDGVIINTTNRIVNIKVVEVNGVDKIYIKELSNAGQISRYDINGVYEAKCFLGYSTYNDIKILSDGTIITAGSVQPGTMVGVADYTKSVIGFQMLNSEVAPFASYVAGYEAFEGVGNLGFLDNGDYVIRIDGTNNMHIISPGQMDSQNTTAVSLSGRFISIT